MARRKFVIPALFTILTAAAGASAQTADRRPMVEVVFDNRAPDGAAEMGTARARTEFMFDEAGIRIAWVLQGAPRGAASIVGERIHLVVLDRAVERLIGSSPTTLGFAIPPANRVYVLYDRVHALARDYGVAPGWLLGLVIAHELTHVLLPRAGHTHTGVMARSISADQGNALSFSREHAQQLRQRLGGTVMLAQR